MKEGERVGPWVLERRLGSGFTGATWIAHRAEGGPEERAVLKIMDLGQAPSWTGVDLFRREAEALRGLSHPGLPRYLEYFEEDAGGRLLLVLASELIEGESLQSAVDSGRRFADPEIESALAGMAEILAYLGSLRPPVVHRDVNPKNVILRPDGRVALVDFSGVQDALRSAASPGATLVGTAGYTPFEQVAGRATPRSDLYGAAATALFLLARRNPAELASRGLKPDLGAFPGLSPRLALVLGSWLEPDEERRELGAAEAAAILRGEAAPPEGAATGLPQRRRASRAASGSGGREPASLPSDSRVVIESAPDRLRILVPAAGLRAGSGALALGGFSLFWIGFVALWTFLSIAMGAPAFFTLFSLPFWVAGAFLARTFVKAAFGSAELVLDAGAGVAFRERSLGPGKARSWPLSDAGRCAIEDAAFQQKGRRERELVLEAGATRLRLGKGLSSRELAAMRDAVDAWLRNAYN